MSSGEGPTNDDKILTCNLQRSKVLIPSLQDLIINLVIQVIPINEKQPASLLGSLSSDLNV